MPKVCQKFPLFLNLGQFLNFTYFHAKILSKNIFLNSEISNIWTWKKLVHLQVQTWQRRYQKIEILEKGLKNRATRKLAESLYTKEYNPDLNVKR